MRVVTLFYSPVDSGTRPKRSSYANNLYLLFEKEIGATRQYFIYFSCLLYVSSFDIDLARLLRGLFFAQNYRIKQLRLATCSNSLT